MKHIIFKIKWLLTETQISEDSTYSEGNLTQTFIEYKIIDNVMHVISSQHYVNGKLVAFRR